MNNNFYKIGFFEINSDLLYDEWLQTSNKFDLFNKTHKLTQGNFCKKYYRMRINHSDNFMKQDDPTLIQGFSEKFDDDTYSIDNIITDFQNTHTAEIAKQVSLYLENKYTAYKVTRIKYHALGIGAQLSLHTDNMSVPRFFLFVRVKEGCLMRIAGDIIPMTEPGALYRFNCKAPHSPINQSDDYRLCMVFDVKKI